MKARSETEIPVDPKQQNTPVFDAVRRYAQAGITPFHVPGHKQGKGATAALKDYVGTRVLGLDIAEIPGVSGFYDQTGLIGEAQNLAAEAFGADATFFLVNGTSGGIQAMIMSVCGPGDKIVIPRNAHRSIVAGLIFSGAEPIYIQPGYDAQLGMAVGLRPEQIAATLSEHPDAKAVLVMSPTYYGIASDLASIAAVVHSRDIPLLVDEAHGPHLAFHPELPRPALAAGADIVVQSTHKILTSLTQSSMLHLKGNRVSRDRAAAMLRLVQTTSASYLLLASLDLARMQMATAGERLLERTLTLAGLARERINRCPGLYSFGAEVIGRPGVHAIDPTKVTVKTADLGFSGRQAEKILRSDYGIQVELSDAVNVLAFFTVGDGQPEADKFATALEDFSRRYAERRVREDARLSPTVPLPPIPRQAVSLREAFFCRPKAIPLAQAAGCVSAGTVAPYPPGIPLLCPGEEISRAAVEYLNTVLDLDIGVQGMQDAAKRMIRVIAD